MLIQSDGHIRFSRLGAGIGYFKENSAVSPTVRVVGPLIFAVAFPAARQLGAGATRAGGFSAGSVGEVWGVGNVGAGAVGFGCGFGCEGRGLGCEGSGWAGRR